MVRNGHRNHHLVKQLRRTAHHVFVSQGQGVESA
jgi:hypothetical protein